MRAGMLKRFAGLMVGLMGICALPALAQHYPSQDIHVVCAWPVATGADTIVRFYAEKLRQLTNRAVIVDNKPGAGGNIGVEYTSKAKPDGHTVLIHGGYNIASNMHLYKRTPLPSVNALQMVATISQLAFVLAVDVNKPYKTLADLTEAMKAKGDRASYGASTPAAVVAGFIYKTKAGLQSVEVSYRAPGDSMNDLLGGNLDYLITDPSAVRQSKLRVLAITSPKRLQSMPDLPTFAEQGYPEIALNLWWSASVPAGTPQPIVDQLNKWFNQITTSDDGKKFVNNLPSDPFVLTPAEAQALLNADDRAWAEYVKMAKIQPQG